MIGNAITDKGLALLARSSKCRSLNRLDLRHNAIRSPASVLKGLKTTMPSLRQASLAQNETGDEAAVAISRTLRRSTLAKLDLSYNTMSENGYQVLLETECPVEVDLAGQRG